ncbi:MAG: TIGR04086 family membrane protein [Clostridiaceae bacterium]|nr:TIGR04086 family membrane protein [Clostridiaceae bacterium]
MQDNYRSGKVSANYFAELLKTVALSLIVTFIVLLAAAFLLCFTDFPEKYTLPSAIAGTLLGVFTGSSMASRKNPDKSLVSSLLTAFIYAVFAFVAGSILQGKVTFTLNTLLFFAISLITGAIANILSNRKKRPSRKYSTGMSAADRLKKKRGAKSYTFGKINR